MNEKNRKVTDSNCNDCIHKSVCCYERDMPDICYAVDKAFIAGSMKKINTFNFLDKIVINCKYYRKETPATFYLSTITTATNPRDISTSASTSTPRSNSDCACDVCIHNCTNYCDKPDWKECKKIFNEPDDVTDERLKGSKNG